jgi:hypothetical protein
MRHRCPMKPLRAVAPEAYSDRYRLKVESKGNLHSSKEGKLNAIECTKFHFY